MLSPQLYNLRAMPLSGEDSRIKMIAPANSCTPTSANLFCAANITRNVNNQTKRPLWGHPEGEVSTARRKRWGCGCDATGTSSTGTAIEHSAGTALINPAHCLKKKEALRGNAHRRSALAAKSANCARLTWDLPPKDLTRKVARRLLVIQAFATRLSVVQPQAVATG